MSNIFFEDFQLFYFLVERRERDLEVKRVNLKIDFSEKNCIMSVYVSPSDLNDRYSC